MLSLIYLFEISKWKQKALTGNISNKGLQQLSQAGIRKSMTNYINGINKGTDIIMKKSGAVKAQNVPERKNYKDYTQSMTNKGRLLLYEPKDVKNRDFTGLSDRHEAFEAKERRKSLNKGILPTNTLTRFYKNSQEKQEHVNPKVLKDEFKTRDQLLSIYPQLKNHQQVKSLVDYRKKTGEDEFVRSRSSRRINKLSNKLDRNTLKTQKLNKEIEDQLEIKHNLVDVINKNPNVTERPITKRFNQIDKRIDNFINKLPKDREVKLDKGIK